MSYKTPGAYVEEIAKFPSSVVQVETAIPAFVGYTDLGPLNTPTRITSMLEYEATFGKAKPEAVKVTIQDGVATATLDTPSDYKMYYALQMYFANGGGPCYIVSVGRFGAGATKANLKAGLDLLEKEDEPTLYVFPDAAKLTTTEAYDLYNLAADQAKKLGDRFVIMDVIDGDVPAFRNKVNSTKYGAAYYPNLETSLNYNLKEADVDVTIKVTSNPATADVTLKLSALETSSSEKYNAAKKAIAALHVVMTPSSAVAGVYAKTDSQVGVWKAPANVGLNYVVAPTVKVSNEEQKDLNVDATAGKSINAIRSFTGKGTLIWGARTLDGNSNEWRYVSVRRLFIAAEESIQKATSPFVFASNDSKTWVSVRSMIENYLTTLWKDGALAGSTPEQAFYVRVGLNETMSAQEILEGIMNIEIGMAAVRPAEFIVLRFSHKLQEA